MGNAEEQPISGYVVREARETVNAVSLHLTTNLLYE